jgi:hypothetical protein
MAAEFLYYSPLSKKSRLNPCRTNVVLDSFLGAIGRDAEVTHLSAIDHVVEVRSPLVVAG